MATEAWTYGQTWKSRLTTYGVLALGAGALIFVSVATSHATASPTTVVEGETVDYTRTDATGASFASGYLRAWLTATDENHEAVDAYTHGLTSVAAEYPAEAQQVGQITTVETKPRSDGAYVVTLAAQVSIVDPSFAPQRYFQIILVPTADGYAAAALPRQITAPTPTSQALTQYRQEVSGDAPVQQTLTGFFDAYLTGQGDLQRFLTPGTDLSPITPAPYSKISITTVMADKPVPAKAEDGTTTDLRVDLTGTASKAYSITTSYELTLTARAGRWEISSMGTPSSHTTLPSTPPSPTPTNSNDAEANEKTAEPADPKPSTTNTPTEEK
ncbi:MAG: conjugal transfer protein [Galactobacter sp.]